MENRVGVCPLRNKQRAVTWDGVEKWEKSEPEKRIAMGNGNGVNHVFNSKTFNSLFFGWLLSNILQTIYVMISVNCFCRRESSRKN